MIIRAGLAGSPALHGVIRLLRLLAGALDQGRKVTDCRRPVSHSRNARDAARTRQRRVRLTGDLEGEVQRCQHDGREDPPAAQAGDEAERAGGDLQPAGEHGVAVGELEVRAGEEAEGDDQRGEDGDEDDVGAQRADQVDEAESAHADLEHGCGNTASIGCPREAGHKGGRERTETRIESDRGRAQGRMRGVGRVRTHRVVGRREGGREAQPESTCTFVSRPVPRSTA